MARSGIDVAVVGATGLVGRELLETLERRRFPVRELLAFNSGRAETTVHFRGRPVRAAAPTPAALRRAQLVFMVSSDEVSRRFSPALAAAGRWVIDDSSAFRLDPNVPLVIPEVNASALSPKRRLIAGPNCTVTGAAVAGRPLAEAAGARAVRIASYQAVSGAGRAALEEFRSQLRRAAPDGSSLLAPPPRFVPRALPRPAAMNVFPHVGSFDARGNSSEETKVSRELRKLWGLPTLRVSVTAVRVPVLRGHSLSVWLETRRPLSPARARALLRRTPGVRLWKDGDYPTPLATGGSWPVHVSRVRAGAVPGRELCFWVVSDNLLKGAALNSAQIAETLLAKGWLGAGGPLSTS